MLHCRGQHSPAGTQFWTHVEFFGSLKTHPSPQKASEQHKLKKKSLANVSSKGRIINQRQRGEARFASFWFVTPPQKFRRKHQRKTQQLKYEEERQIPCSLATDKTCKVWLLTWRGNKSTLHSETGFTKTKNYEPWACQNSAATQDLFTISRDDTDTILAILQYPRKHCRKCSQKRSA